MFILKRPGDELGEVEHLGVRIVFTKTTGKLDKTRSGTRQNDLGLDRGYIAYFCLQKFVR